MVSFAIGITDNIREEVIDQRYKTEENHITMGTGSIPSGVTPMNNKNAVTIGSN
ncbi:hypothetical protein D3C80_1499340 [compost metagenome]